MVWFSRDVLVSAGPLKLSVEGGVSLAGCGRMCLTAAAKLEGPRCTLHQLRLRAVHSLEREQLSASRSRASIAPSTAALLR
jgi:hypothetical protein